MRRLLPHADWGGWEWFAAAGLCTAIRWVTGMLASWRTIAVFFDDTPEGTKVADQAAGIADRCGAHLIGIHAVRGHPGESSADCFVRGKLAIHEMIARHSAVENSLD